MGTGNADVVSLDTCADRFEVALNSMTNAISLLRIGGAPGRLIWHNKHKSAESAATGVTATHSGYNPLEVAAMLGRFCLTR